MEVVNANDLPLGQLIPILRSLYIDKHFLEAKRCLPNLFHVAKNSNQTTEDFRKNLTNLYKLAGDILGELGEYDVSLRYYENFQCLKMQLRTNIFKNSDPKECITLYQFRRFADYNLSNLLNREITLSRPAIMNDVVDSLINVWLNSDTFGSTAHNKQHLKPYAESFRDYRIASFCEDNQIKGQYALQNHLMWSHYADEHRGFCIEYSFHNKEFRADDFSNVCASRLFRINYHDTLVDGPINLSDIDFHLTATTAFLTKSIEWNYENEVRLLQYKPLNGNIRTQYSLAPETIIKSIYFGCRCPKEDIQIITKLLRDTGIKFYQMEIDYSNVYRLKFRELT